MRNEMTIISIVDFTGGSDGVTALYINDKLYKYGDDYHDKIRIWIPAFIEGLKMVVDPINIITKKIKVLNEEIIADISEYANIPPKELTEETIKQFSNK